MGKEKSISHTFVPFHWRGDRVESIFKHKSRMFSESAASSVGNRCTQVMLAQISNQKQIPLMKAQSQKQQVQNSDINFGSDLFC